MTAKYTEGERLPHELKGVESKRSLGGVGYSTDCRSCWRGTSGSNELLSIWRCNSDFQSTLGCMDSLLPKNGRKVLIYYQLIG